MMFYRISVFFFTLTMFSAITGCTSTNNHALITTPTQVTKWEARLPKHAHGIKITYSLPQTATADFQFFNGAPKHINEAIARVTFSNENCVMGHVASIIYKQNTSDFYSKYFDKEVIWNKPNTLIITFPEKNIIAVTIADETHQIALTHSITTLNITSQTTPIEIHNIEYLLQ